MDSKISFKHLCEVCGQTFESLNAVNKHLVFIHNYFICPIDRPFPCFRCGKMFSTKFNLFRHEVEVHKMHLPFSCDNCPKKFKRRRKLHEHKRKKHPSPKVPCILCGIFCESQERVNSHIILEHPKCHFCNVWFFSQYQFREHNFYIHNGVELQD